MVRATESASWRSKLFALGMAAVAAACAPEARSVLGRPGAVDAAVDVEPGLAGANGGAGNEGAAGAAGSPIDARPADVPPAAGASGGTSGSGGSPPMAGAGGSGGVVAGAMAGIGGAMAGAAGGAVAGATGGAMAGSAAGAMAGAAGMMSTLTVGLVGWWKMDGAAGSATAVDSSGRGNPATLTGLAPASAWTTGRAGGALDCSGNGGALVNDSASLDEIASGVTIAAWVRIASVTAGYTVIASRQTGTSFNEHYWLGLHDGKPRYFGEQGSIVAAAALPTGQWRHVAITHDGTTARLYVGGAEVINAALAGAFTPDTSKLTICGNQNDAAGTIAERFVGQVDDLRLYKRALTPAELVMLAQ